MSANVFLYGLVAHGNTPIAEFAAIEGGNIKAQAGKILEEIDPKEPQGYFQAGAHQFDTLTEPDRMVYLCLTVGTASKALRVSFLTELKQKWRAKYGNTGATMNAYEKSAEFSAEFRRLFTTFNSDRAQKIAQVKENLQKAQDETAQNLTKALARGEQLDVMSTKADKIKSSATAFHREAGNVRRQMFFQKIKWYLLGGIIILVVLFIIIMFACGGPAFSKCKSDSDG
jgi:vesicle-associated membrane protein 7